MFHYLLHTKGGFTLTELAIVLVVLGILTAVAIPIYSSGSNRQKKNDCANQCQVLEATVKQAMTGMFDNGKSQDAISFYEPESSSELSCVVQRKFAVDGGAFGLKPCLELSPDEMPTLGDIRGGYRPDGDEKYNKSCDSLNNWYFLKKKKLKDVPFNEYLANAEIPVCPFSKDGEPPIYYVVTEDGSVYCPHCSNPANQ